MAMDDVHISMHSNINSLLEKNDSHLFYQIPSDKITTILKHARPDPHYKCCFDDLIVHSFNYNIFIMTNATATVLKRNYTTTLFY